MQEREGLSKAQSGSREDHGHPSAWPAYCLLAALMLATLIPPFDLEVLGTWGPLVLLNWIAHWHWFEALLVSMPFWLSVIASLRLRQLWSEVKHQFELCIGPLPYWPTVNQTAHDFEQKCWQQVAVSAKTAWTYERQRHLRSLQRLGLNVLILGNVVTLILTVCTRVLLHPTWNVLENTEQTKLLMISVLTAASTAFLVRFVRAIVRISGGDITCRMFAWAVRSVVLVVVADIGLFVLLQGNVNSVGRALLLGLFAGATCDRALDLMLDKAAALFKTTTPSPRGPSPLLALEGITAEHVERLEEEGIYSVHDLAFVPTARLFFGTAHSLQQICDWQDRALLHVYVGGPSVKDLEQRMKIIDASALLFCCQTILNGPLDQGDRNQLKEQLRAALGIEEGGLQQLIYAMAHDDMTMRVRLYSQSSVLTQETRKLVQESAAPVAHDAPRLDFEPGAIPTTARGAFGE